MKISLSKTISEFLPLADGESVLDHNFLLVEMTKFVVKQCFLHLRDGCLDLS